MKRSAENVFIMMKIGAFVGFWIGVLILIMIFGEAATVHIGIAGLVALIAFYVVVFGAIYILEKLYKEETYIKTSLEKEQAEKVFTPDASTITMMDITSSCNSILADTIELKASVDYLIGQVSDIESLCFSKKAIKKQQKNMKKLSKSLRRVEKEIEKREEENTPSVYEIGQRLAKAVADRKEKSRKTNMTDGERVHQDGRESEEVKKKSEEDHSGGTVESSSNE